jgi:hypothetical protein
MAQTDEHERLVEYRERTSNWKRWGPYLSERAWGTVREDYSAHGTAWDYFPHDHARSRAYRWNEDGLAGICDRRQYLCFALALWNGSDPILKERLYGLAGPEGNHGEDVKEHYFYLDSTPTHSYLKMLYKYPQAEFPYGDLVRENGRRGAGEFEYELLDTGVFAEDRYFDVLVEYAKSGERDILVRISVTNRGPEAATCHVLPTLWYRNTWSWGYEEGPMGGVPGRPNISQIEGPDGALAAETDHPRIGTYSLYAEGASELLFTENETNIERLYGLPNASPYVKDSFHRYLIHGQTDAVNPAGRGTKVTALYKAIIESGATHVVRLRLCDASRKRPFQGFGRTFAQRITEADAFYQAVQAPGLSEDERRIQRQALAGMLWSKQLYYYDVEQWLRGDPAGPQPPASRKQGRNHVWAHLNNFDLLSMPDKWEYPWYACWDLAFHCLPLALLDADFAKRQIELMTREWYMHPNGQLPAYEWAFGDVNPPVHAWAAWRVYQIDAQREGKPDIPFLKGIYHKLLLNFTWWVNRKDLDDNNVFQGGFLGLDNISIFDRSQALPHGGHIDQSDGTAWMGFYCLGMMRISLELAKEDPVYEDLATKFYEHFLSIAHAVTNRGGAGYSLWDEGDCFFYDVLHMPDRSIVPLKVRSLVGLMPLLAVETIEPQILREQRDFRRRLRWFTRKRPHLSGNMASVDVPGVGQRVLTAILTQERLESVLRYMLDEDEFLSPYGIRSLSKVHHEHPYSVIFGGETFTINYQPAESQTGMFGGNSNWRGPIWFPINYLIIESLRKFHSYYGDTCRVECPTGSGKVMTLDQVADELSRRLMRIFLRDEQGRRPVYGGTEVFQQDPHWRDLVLFYEYFHGDNGAGLGASHQTGWTGLIAQLIQRQGAV